jgi:CRP/FNR family transcriptional regulator, cyclic AMP receptor protein
MSDGREKVNETAVSSYRKGEFFKSLSSAALADLESLLNASSYSSNLVLFRESQPTSGVFIVLEGEVRLTSHSTDGRRVALHIAQPGEVLGLSSTLSGGAYEMTADTLYPAKVAHISREAFLGFLSRHPEVESVVSCEIENGYNLACDRLRTMEPSDAAPQRQGRLLLVWSDSHQQGSNSRSRHTLTMTQEEMGEFIGSSCQTVFRTLSIYKNQERIAHHGCTLSSSSSASLENYTRK